MAEPIPQVTRIMFTTVDPTLRELNGEVVTLPALTTMLHAVCRNDDVRFQEACRLIQLFIEKALADD